jgi:hypothetical protein
MNILCHSMFRNYLHCFSTVGMLVLDLVGADELLICPCIRLFYILYCTINQCFILGYTALTMERLALWDITPRKLVTVI